MDGGVYFWGSSRVILLFFYEFAQETSSDTLNENVEETLALHSKESLKEMMHLTSFPIGFHRGLQIHPLQTIIIK